MSTQAASVRGILAFQKTRTNHDDRVQALPGGYRFSAFDINSPFGTIKGRPAS